MKNLFRIHIHPNRIGAVRDSEVKQLFLNAKPRRIEFGESKRPFFNFFISIEFTFFIAPPFCNLSFYYKQADGAEVPGVNHEFKKIELEQKTYNLFSLCHPPGFQ